jgi:thiol:disulfide interchange protein DsbC
MKMTMTPAFFGRRSLSVLGLCLGLALPPVSAQTQADTKQRIQQTLEKMVPDAPQAEITPTPVDGVWQVLIGSQIIYMSADAEYFFNGNLISLATRENLTEKALNAQREQALTQLDSESMIVYPAEGPSKQTITVFTDVDCPYCRKLHREIPELNEAGVTVRYLAYAREGVQSKAFAKSEKIWCAQSSADVMDQAMSGESLENVIAKPGCQPPVRQHMQQSQLFGVQGTPTIILEDGRRLPGYVPAEELLPMLGLSGSQ